MRKDPTEFRKRFQSWKLGIPAYRAGKPIGEDEDTRSDTTRQGYHEGDIPYGAGNGPAGDSPLKILDAVNEKYAAVHNRPGLVMGEPPAVGIGNPGMFNNSFLTKLFGSPSKAVGRQPMFMTDAIKSNTANLKSALMRYEGNAPSKLTKQGKAWVDYNKNNVDLSQFTAMDVNKLVKMNRKDLNLKSGQFVKVTKGGPGFADYTFDVMKDGSSIADMEIGLRNGVAVPEMVSSFTKQPGMSRTLYDAAILSGEQLGYNGLLSGEQLISAPKTWSVWEHYPTKKLVKENGIHQNRMMTSNPNKDGRRLKNLEEAKKAAEEGRSFTIENGPVYLLDKESLFVPVKSADVFDASILDANGVFHRNMNSTNIYKAMLPFAIGGGLWVSKEHKNGKDLPRYEDGDDLKVTIDRGTRYSPIGGDFIWRMNPVNEAKYRLYKNMSPYSYAGFYERAKSAIFDDIAEENQKDDIIANDPRDDQFATYLGIPKEMRRLNVRKLQPALYHPTLNEDTSIPTYRLPLTKNEIHRFIKSQYPFPYGTTIVDPDTGDSKNLGVLPFNKNIQVSGIWDVASKALTDAFGSYTEGHGLDKNRGEYFSYYDRYDLNPTSGDNAVNDDILNRLPEWYLKKLKQTGDVGINSGITHPFALYDRIYLNDYYGVNDQDVAPDIGDYYGGYFPEITVYPKHKYKSGKDIYIKPSHRGRFTALKKRTGHSASWFKAHGTPALKKMATFELNSKKWHKH